VFRLQQRSQCNEVGKLSQDVTLFQGTVRENIARFADGDIDQVIQAAKYAGIHDAIINLPEGYDTEICEREPLLSFSQRKGIALARAFYGAPPLVVLDEPMPHIDQRGRADLLRGIKSLNEDGTIVVLTTQSNYLCKFADKVLVLGNFKHHILQTHEDIQQFHKDVVINDHGQGRRKNSRKNNIARVEGNIRKSDSKQRSA
jgi:ABC-type protease/lipase transport system fused ATPase/permease subunit